MTHDFLGSLGLLALGSRLKRAGTLLQSATQTWLRNAGCDVPAGHMPLLAALDETGQASLGALADLLGIAQPGVSRMVAALEAAGLVATVASGEDRRVRLLELTPQGRDLVADARAFWWPVVQDAVAELCAELDGPFSDQLAAFEEKLAAGAYERLLEARLDGGRQDHDAS